MGELVTYRFEDSIATITLDDGKVNALSPAMFAEINGALDDAEKAGGPVVLTGREGVFSGGFDLKTLRAGGEAAEGMVRSGFELSARLLTFPQPVVAACTGHAIAMGVFVLLSVDYRLGTLGPYRYLANEVAIGLTMPWPAIELSRHRLVPAQFERAMVLSTPFDPDEAVQAGFIDRAVDAADLAEQANTAASEFAKLDLAAHQATKLRVRGQLVSAIRSSLDDLNLF